MHPTNVKVKRLDKRAELPEQMTAGAAGFDVRCIETVKFLPRHHIERVRTGLAFSVPTGYELQVRPRSGLAAKGVVLRNAPGTIDSDYRGEVIVLLSSEYAMDLERGTRIAQLVLQQVPQMQLTEVDELDNTERGAAGFGSTGTM